MNPGQPFNSLTDQLLFIRGSLLKDGLFTHDHKPARHSEQRLESGASSQEGYKPMVTVYTKATPLPGGAGGGLKQVQISVSDNGPGIPKQVREKIFQPFFTTKPTGSGTGLGLSLSYDIVTKGQNGSLEVDTTEGVGSEFIIQIPINS